MPRGSTPRRRLTTKPGSGFHERDWAVSRSRHRERHGGAAVARLDPALFIRLHRSTIVRRDRITALRREPAGSWVALLADGNAVPIGRTYLDAARALRG